MYESRYSSMDINSNASYPANKLSNFACNPFVIDGIECNSMEGFLQSLKFKNPEMQKEICKLVGIGAKKSGQNKNWRNSQTLYWQGKPVKRDSEEYQILLDKAFDALSRNSAFAKALISSGNCSFTHSMGKNKITQTVLTRQEFISRLLKIRAKLQGVVATDDICHSLP